jgi:hypothetical protein
MAPLSEPPCPGVKVTLILQLWPPATLVPQLLVSLKFAEALMLITVRGNVLVFDNVTICAALVWPTGVLGNAKLDGLNIGLAGELTTWSRTLETLAAT